MLSNGLAREVNCGSKELCKWTREDIVKRYKVFGLKSGHEESHGNQIRYISGRAFSAFNTPDDRDFLGRMRRPLDAS